MTVCKIPMSLPRPNGRGSSDRIIVPCGKCAVCMTNRRNDWITRIFLESKNYIENSFITLTYNEESLRFGQLYPSLDKNELQNFLKRFRKQIKKNIRYYAVGEYGEESNRPHYHLIMFNVSIRDRDIIEKCWKHGFVHVGSVEIASIAYVCKYHINKGNPLEGSESPFILMSKGLARKYAEDFKDYHSKTIERNFIQDYEFRRRMPRYIKEKVYSESQRKMIAGKLEKKEKNLIKKDSNYFISEVLNIEEDKLKFNLKSKYNKKI